jgi:hypothetical protein
MRTTGHKDPSIPGMYTECTDLWKLYTSKIARDGAAAAMNSQCMQVREKRKTSDQFGDQHRIDIPAVYCYNEYMEYAGRRDQK